MRRGPRSRPRSWLRAGSRGQASVELVAAGALVLVAALAGAEALQRGSEQAAADAAAHAGALAVAAGERPGPAARAALPGWAKDRVRVSRKGGAVVVELRRGTEEGGASLAVRSRAYVRDGD